ncbi:MAG: hypothetical protein HKN25_07485 [Pyrinomonadaceae bacterium]|nr:hypothetical protein [Pyrinomonadaceae bacterium]
MNSDFIRSIAERFALLDRFNEISTDSESLSELVPVDYDFDIENKTNFDTYLSLRFFCNDWKPFQFEVF